MDIATFHASRRFADVKSGRIAFYESGRGPAALFVHGVFTGVMSSTASGTGGAASPST
jgi:hypothetical protein